MMQLSESGAERFRMAEEPAVRREKTAARCSPGRPRTRVLGKARRSVPRPACSAHARSGGGWGRVPLATGGPAAARQLRAAAAWLPAAAALDGGGEAGGAGRRRRRDGGWGPPPPATMLLGRKPEAPLGAGEAGEKRRERPLGTGRDPRGSAEQCGLRAGGRSRGAAGMGVPCLRCALSAPFLSEYFSAAEQTTRPLLHLFLKFFYFLFSSRQIRRL